jgi:hypothetical protein
MNVANSVLWRMAIVLKANKVNLFVSSVLFVFWYHSPNFLDTPLKTNLMHFLFNLLRIKGFYMFHAFSTHPQEALNKRHLVYCVRVMSVGCIRIGMESSTPTLVQTTDITRMQYTTCHLFSAFWGWARNVRNMYRSLTLNKLNKKCITLVSLYRYTMMPGQQNIKVPTGLNCKITKLITIQVYSHWRMCVCNVIFQEICYVWKGEEATLHIVAFCVYTPFKIL